MSSASGVLLLLPDQPPAIEQRLEIWQRYVLGDRERKVDAFASTVLGHDADMCMQPFRRDVSEGPLPSSQRMVP